MAKTWSKDEIVALMVETVREVRVQCYEFNQPYQTEDAIEQVYDDLNERGLIEHTP